MDRNKEEFERYNNVYDDMLDRTILAQRNASDSTGVLTQNVEGSTVYLKVVQDVHGNYAKLRKELLELSKIPNAYVLFLGDVSTNGNIENEKHGNVYGNLRTPEEEILKLIKTLETEGVDIKKMMIGYLDGNHELRIQRKTSIRPGKIVTDVLGCPEKYVQNAAKVVLELDNPLNKDEKVKISGFVRHGENTPSNPGANVEVITQKALVSGVNFVLAGHTHNMSYGNSVINYCDARGNEKQKTVIAANFGSDQKDAEYADRAGYPMNGRPDGEMIRIALVLNEKKNDYSTCIDMVNSRDILNHNAVESYDKAVQIINNIEKLQFSSEKELKEVYKEVSKKISKLTTNNTRRSALKELTTTVFFAPWCGFKIGDKKLKNENDIDEAIALVKNLPNCKVVLNGDMIKYKDPEPFNNKSKVNKKKSIHNPEDSYAYLDLLARKLEPIKDKIIAYNSGVEETKIMKHHGNELAKFAMTRLQMDENLAYEPYNKQEYRAEQLKIQGQQVEEYNKKVLKDECARFVMNADKYAEFLKYLEEKKKLIESQDTDEQNNGNEQVVNINTSDELKNYVAKILRKEKKLLSTNDKEEINRRFPLSAIDLKNPNKNLVQNILCTMLGINPKKISINPEYNTQTKNTVKLYTEEGKSQPIYLTGCYSTSVAGRGAQESNMSRTQSHNLGYDIYYVNSKLGGEYITKTASVYDDNGETKIKDVYHIAGARFDGARNYVNNTTSTNRIYRFKRILKNEFVKYGETNGRTMYRTDGDYTIVANSINYHSALFNEDIRLNMLLNMLKISYDKKYNEYMKNKKTKVFDIEGNFLKDVTSWEAKALKEEQKKTKRTKKVVKKVENKETAENKETTENENLVEKEQAM